MPVTEHGLYEWNLYEPSLDAVIVPFLFARAGEQPGTLLQEGFDVAAPVARPVAVPPPRARRDPLGDASGPTGSRARRSARSRWTAPRRTRSRISRAACASSPPRWPIRTARTTRRSTGTSSTRPGTCTARRRPEFDAAIREALDAMEPLTRLEGVTVLFTADHGQVDVAPDRVDYLDEVWPRAARPTSRRTSRPARRATSSCTCASRRP